jgi:hypothetical protein
MSLRIRAKTNGFRRAGIAHSSDPTVYPDGFFSDAQLTQLRAEPELVVEELDDAPLVEGDVQRDPKVEAPETSAARERGGDHEQQDAHEDTALDLAKEAMTAEGGLTADAAKSNTGDEGQPAVAEPAAPVVPAAPAAASASSASAADVRAMPDPKVEKPANRNNSGGRRNK